MLTVLEKALFAFNFERQTDRRFKILEHTSKIAKSVKKVGMQTKQWMCKPSNDTHRALHFLDQGKMYGNAWKPSWLMKNLEEWEKPYRKQHKWASPNLSQQVHVCTCQGHRQGRYLYDWSKHFSWHSSFQVVYITQAAFL